MRTLRVVKPVLALLGFLLALPALAREHSSGARPNPWIAAGDEATATSVVISTSGTVVVKKDSKGVSDVSVTFTATGSPESRDIKTKPPFRLHTNGTVTPTREGDVIKVAVSAPREGKSRKGTECELNHDGNGCVNFCPSPGACTYHHDSQNNYCDCNKK